MVNSPCLPFKVIEASHWAVWVCRTKCVSWSKCHT